MRSASTLVCYFQTLVGKKAKLTISGANTELDKLLINQLADPLVHIMRNSLDHGFELPEERARLGKPEFGEIQLSAYYQGSNAVIEVKDDGKGIDPDIILKKAIEKGLVSAQASESLSKREILELLFEPGFSSVDKVSQLSGRGVGMDVVKTAVSQVQGTVVMESELGKGTTIWMRLPLTLAIVGILLAEENGNQFAFPVLNVVEILSIKHSELKRVGEGLVFHYRGHSINVTSLSQMLSFPSSTFDRETTPMIVLTDGERQIGILVDEVKGRRDVLIKQFGSLISRIKFMMGCTILSDSSLVLILNVWEIVNDKTKPVFDLVKSSPGSRRTSRSKHTILVVDDSAMQRNRLSSILSQAGFRVEVATDGHDALMKTSKTNFSAFCVDILMPLMDGYEFVEKLRLLPDYADAPVLMVTGKRIQKGAERRRLDALNTIQVFEKPVNETEIITVLDSVCPQENQ